MIKLKDILFEGKLSKSQIKKMRDKFDKTGKLPPHLQKLANLMDKHSEIEDIVVPGLEWMADIKEGKLTESSRVFDDESSEIQGYSDRIYNMYKSKTFKMLLKGKKHGKKVSPKVQTIVKRLIPNLKSVYQGLEAIYDELLGEEKLTERRAQQARNWLDAVKLSRKGAGRKLQYKDKNGNPIYGNSQFYFQKVLHQVYPDDERMAYVAYNKKRNKVRSLNNFFTSDWKKIEIATG